MMTFSESFATDFLHSRRIAATYVENKAGQAGRRQEVEVSKGDILIKGCVTL